MALSHTRFPGQSRGPLRLFAAGSEAVCIGSLFAEAAVQTEQRIAGNCNFLASEFTLIKYSHQKMDWNQRIKD